MIGARQVAGRFAAVNGGKWVIFAAPLGQDVPAAGRPGELVGWAIGTAVTQGALNDYVR